MSVIDGDGQELDSLRVEMNLLLSQLRSELTQSNQLEIRLLSSLNEEEEIEPGDQTSINSGKDDLIEVVSEDTSAAENDLSLLQTLVSEMADVFSSFLNINFKSSITSTCPNTILHCECDYPTIIKFYC